jgi:hypothetical protein
MFVVWNSLYIFVLLKGKRRRGWTAKKKRKKNLEKFCGLKSLAYLWPIVH